MTTFSREIDLDYETVVPMELYVRLSVSVATLVEIVQDPEADDKDIADIARYLVERCMSNPLLSDKINTINGRGK